MGGVGGGEALFGSKSKKRNGGIEFSRKEVLYFSETVIVRHWNTLSKFLVIFRTILGFKKILENLRAHSHFANPCISSQI